MSKQLKLQTVQRVTSSGLHWGDQTRTMLGLELLLRLQRLDFTGGNQDSRYQLLTSHLATTFHLASAMKRERARRVGFSGIKSESCDEGHNSLVSPVARSPGRITCPPLCLRAYLCADRVFASTSRLWLRAHKNQSGRSPVKAPNGTRQTSDLSEWIGCAG